MVKLSHQSTSKRGVEPVAVAFCSTSISDAIAKALSGFSAKAVAARLRKVGASVSARTVEAWKQARRAPRAEHVFGLLSDDEFCALVLAEVNPALAVQAEILATKKKLRTLEAKQ